MKSDKKIKILFLIDELIAGGTEKQLILLAEGLPRGSFEPIIGIFNTNAFTRNLKIKSSIVNFNLTGLPIIKNIILLLKIRAYLKKNKINIMQTHLFESTIYGAFAILFLKKKISLIATRRNLYHWIKDEPWLFRLYRFTNRWTDKIIVNSTSVLKRSSELENIPEHKIHLIENAIDAKIFQNQSTKELKTRLNLHNKYPIIGVVANWRAVKGLVPFLKSLKNVIAEYPRTKILLVGGGPQETELRTLAIHLGIESFVEFVENFSEVNIILNTFDIAVQPSLSESFSNALIEYMAAGRAVVATRVGDAALIIEHDKDGLLVNPDQPEELYEAISQLAADKKKAVEMGNLAREKVIQKWDLKIIVEKYEQFYTDLIKEEEY